MAEVPFKDDPGIGSDTLLWRRIPPWPGYSVFDRNEGRLRPSTQAFRENRDGSPMSVFIASECGEIDAVLEGHAGFGLVELSVRLIRGHGLGIARDPAGGGPGHAVVFPAGDDPGAAGTATRISRRAQEALALGCRWIVMPAGAQT